MFPYVVVSPAYFAGAMQLGGLMQTASAFNSVQKRCRSSSTSTAQLAEWRAVIERLAGFELAVAAARAAARTPPVIEVLPAPTGATRSRSTTWRSNLPTGAPLVAADDIALPPGDRVLVTGPSGSGKSTLFRAIAGIWPFGSGRVLVPQGARLMMLPQRPYFPVGTLAAARDLSGRAGQLRPRADRRGDRAPSACRRWCSGSTRRRTGTACCRSASSSGSASPARCCRSRTYLFLDEATASLDEPRRRRSTGCCRSGCRTATIVSIGHRSTLGAFHRRRPGARARRRAQFRVRAKQPRLERQRQIKKRAAAVCSRRPRRSGDALT